MKKILIFSIITCFLGACATSSKTSESQEQSETSTKMTKLEYDKYSYLIPRMIAPPQFYSWLQMQPSLDHYSQEWLENKNQRLVNEWNMRHNSPLEYSAQKYAVAIEYSYNENYGLEANYLLYQYFKYARLERR